MNGSHTDESQKDSYWHQDNRHEKEKTTPELNMERSDSSGRRLSVINNAGDDAHLFQRKSSIDDVISAVARTSADHTDDRILMLSRRLSRMSGMSSGHRDSTAIAEEEDDSKHVTEREDKLTGEKGYSAFSEDNNRYKYDQNRGHDGHEHPYNYLMDSLDPHSLELERQSSASKQGASVEPVERLISVSPKSSPREQTPHWNYSQELFHEKPYFVAREEPRETLNVSPQIEGEGMDFDNGGRGLSDKEDVHAQNEISTAAVSETAEVDDPLRSNNAADSIAGSGFGPLSGFDDKAFWEEQQDFTEGKSEEGFDLTNFEKRDSLGTVNQEALQSSGTVDDTHDGKKIENAEKNMHLEEIDEKKNTLRSGLSNDLVPKKPLEFLNLDDDLLLDEDFLDNQEGPSYSSGESKNTFPVGQQDSRNTVGSGNVTVPSKDEGPISSQDFLRRLDESKKKNDAYDFPENLIPKTVRPAARMSNNHEFLSSKKQPKKSEQSSLGTVNSSDSQNILSQAKSPSLLTRPPGNPAKKFFEDLPLPPPPAVRPARAAAPKNKEPHNASPYNIGAPQMPPLNPYAPQGSPAPQGGLAPVHSISPLSAVKPPRVVAPRNKEPYRSPPQNNGPSTMPSINPYAPQGGSAPVQGGLFSSSVPSFQTADKVTIPNQNLVSSPYDVSSPPSAGGGSTSRHMQPFPVLQQDDFANPSVRNSKISRDANTLTSGAADILPRPQSHTVTNQYIPNSGPYAPSKNKVMHSRGGSLVGANRREINPYAPASTSPVSPNLQIPSGSQGVLPPINNITLGASNVPRSPSASVSGTRVFSRIRGTSASKMLDAKETIPPKIQNPEALLSKQFPIFTWSSSNRAACLIPSQVTNQYNSHVGESIRVFDVSTFFKDKGILSTFPGPLLKSKTKKNEVEKWLGSYKDYSINNLMSTGSDEYLLVSLLAALLKYNGNLESKEFIRDYCTLLNPGVDYSSSSSRSLPISDSLNVMTNAHRLDNSGMNHVWSILQYGDVDKALLYCILKDDWALAFILANSLGKEKFSEIVRRYVAYLYPSTKSPHRSVHLGPMILRLFAGDYKGVIADFYNIESESDWALSNWKEIISIVLTNGVIRAEFLIDFGKFLCARGKLFAYQICYILAQVPFSNGTNQFDAEFSFIGLKTASFFYSELYDYILQLSVRGYPEIGKSHLIPLKLKHAEVLADYGLFGESRKYCDNISSSIKATGKQSLAFPILDEFESLVNRLSESSANELSWLPSRISKVNLDKVWGRLDKFIGGDDLAAKSEGNTVFSKFKPSLSRSTSSVDIPRPFLKNETLGLPRESRMETSDSTNYIGKTPLSTEHQSTINQASNLPMLMLNNTPWPLVSHKTTPGNINLAHRVSHAPSSQTESKTNLRDVNDMPHMLSRGGKSSSQQGDRVLPPRNLESKYSSSVNRKNFVSEISGLVPLPGTDGHPSVTSGSHNNQFKGDNAIGAPPNASNLPENASHTPSSYLESSSNAPPLGVPISLSRNSKVTKTESITNAGDDSALIGLKPEDSSSNTLKELSNGKVTDSVSPEVSVPPPPPASLGLRKKAGSVVNNPSRKATTKPLYKPVPQQGTASHAGKYAPEATVRKEDNATIISNTGNASLNNYNTMGEGHILNLTLGDNALEESKNKEETGSPANFSESKVTRPMFQEKNSVPSVGDSGFRPIEPQNQTNMSSKFLKYGDALPNIDNSLVEDAPADIETSSTNSLKGKASNVPAALGRTSFEGQSMFHPYQGRSDSATFRNLGVDSSFGDFSVPGSPDATTRANSVVGAPGFFTSKLSQSQSAMYQQYEVKDDTVRDYIPVVEEEGIDSEEEETTKEKAQKKNKAQDSSRRDQKGGHSGEKPRTSKWFKWLGSKNDDKPKPVRAKLGVKSSFYYDDKLQRWINKDIPLEEQTKPKGPPPPPMLKKKTTEDLKPPAMSKPLPPLTQQAPLPSRRDEVPQSIGSTPKGVPPTPPAGTPSSKPSVASAGLDDLLSLGSARQGTGRRPKRGTRRGYVNVLEQQQQQKNN